MTRNIAREVRIRETFEAVGARVSDIRPQSDHYLVGFKMPGEPAARLARVTTIADAQAVAAQAKRELTR